jgi:hypothetical protein
MGMTRPLARLNSSTQVMPPACPLPPTNVQISSRYGTETNKAQVDWTVTSPGGALVHSEQAVSESEVELHAQGGQGPWKACFKVTRGQVLRPSVIVKVGLQTLPPCALGSFPGVHMHSGWVGPWSYRVAMAASARQWMERSCCRPFPN